MKLEWDETKAASNLRKHGIRFDAIAGFEFDTALVERDADASYGEERLKACGFIGSKLYVLVYVERGQALRIISLRRATQLEKRTYEDDINQGW